MEIQKLKVSEIIIRDRLRGVDSKKVERLKESILKVGLIHPITVSNCVLVAGLHRLTAYKELGLEDIDCYIIEDDELLQKEIEIDENLHRNELSVLERGRMESIKKNHEIEWQKRQLVIPSYFTTPGDTVYEYVQIDSITHEAKINLIGSEYENNKKFLLDLSTLSKDKQISITSNLTVNGIDDYVRIEKQKEIRDRYPEKDKNQIKFQIDDEHMDMALTLIHRYKWKSLPELARRLFETYLDIAYKDKEDLSSDDIDLMEMFSGLQEPSRDDFQDIKRGIAI